MKNLKDGFELVWYLFLWFFIIITGFALFNSGKEYRVILGVLFGVQLLTALIIGIYLYKKYGGDKK